MGDMPRGRGLEEARFHSNGVVQGEHHFKVALERSWKSGTIWGGWEEEIPWRREECELELAAGRAQVPPSELEELGWQVSAVEAGREGGWVWRKRLPRGRL